jgi:predicted dehydrogenase
MKSKDESMTTPLHRRAFLSTTATHGAMLALSAASYRAVVADEPPSERIRVGMIGVGNQGGPGNNMKDFKKNIVAVCDLDAGYVARATAFMEKEASLKVSTTDDYRRVLDSKEVDAVVVTVPDHWHAIMTIDACKAGKDVFCEKPLSLTIDEGKRMVAVAKEQKRVVQTGSMQRSGDEFNMAIELLKKGIIGKIKSVNVVLPPPNWVARAKMPIPDSAPPEGFDYERWLGPAPFRPYNKNHLHYLFRFYWDYSGGQQTNFGAHHLDIAQWGLGMDKSGPVSVEGKGVFHPEKWYETPDTTEITYTYDNGVTMVCRQTVDGKGQGTQFIGEKGSLYVYRGGLRTDPKELLAGIPIPKWTNFNANHTKNFLDCIKSRGTPVADIAIGHRSATVCHLGNIAVRTGKKVTWDPVKEEITGDAELAKWQRREYRKGYTLG